jgi:phospholipase C
MLASKRIEAAPTLAQVLNLTEARNEIPVIPPPPAEIKQTGTFLPLNELQKTIISAKAVQQNKDRQQTLAQITTRQQAIAFFQRQR